LKQGNVQDTACQVLGALKVSECIPEFQALLEDDSWMVRTSALSALKDCGSLPQDLVLEKLLHDESARVRIAAIEAISDLGKANHLSMLKLMLSDPEPGVRRSAAIAMCEKGFKVGLELLLDDPAGMVHLNALTSPRAWESLSKVQIPVGSDGFSNDLLEGVSAKAGLSLQFQLGEDAAGRARLRLTKRWIRIQEKGLSGAELMELLAQAGFGIVVGDHDISVREFDRTLDFWRKWVKSNS
jgi:vesicle coat complex subunit